MLGLVPFRFFSFWYLWAHSCHKATTGLKQKGQMTMDFLPLTQYLAVFQGPTIPQGTDIMLSHQSRAEHRKTKYIQRLAHQFMFPPWDRFSAPLHQTNSHLLFRVSHSLNWDLRLQTARACHVIQWKTHYENQRTLRRSPFSGNPHTCRNLMDD